ncbi:PIG-L deacetylase family protein [Paenibacillus sp. FSL H7-0331]|uniref:PIG-L deacetylase family protein n=1 Tax=Paenibacillus sp. FSL H7-0331 TaxID=1920421 RepID=UPI00096D1650|nr:PIG-L deacetylase family protein [Paenibacillus sp. FSL H7-0331]OMF13092.1 GlcNAc-PI de-N-acetylase [Paenibacillus sp. FSL H7-0331]
MSNTILVIAAHPDDEILGCGGTIAWHKQQGDKVHVAILAEGLTSRDKQRDRNKHEAAFYALADAAREANLIVGATSLVLHSFPDNRMDSLDRLDIVKYVEELIEEYRPDIVYTHHNGDVNIDHRCIHEAVVTACRPIPGNQRIKSLLFFEVASSTEWQTPGSAVPFLPNWFVDISETLTLKLTALEAYSSEMRNWPHARSVKAIEYLAKWRGATIGVDAAEAFILGRQIK